MTNKLLKGLGGCLALATLAVPAFCFNNTFAADMSVYVDGENIYSTGHNTSNTAKYDKTTGTLTLDNFNGKYINIVNGGAKVVVNGTNKISYDAAMSGSGYIEADDDLSFSGTGSVTFSNASGINCGVSTEGNIAISGGSYNITCSNGRITAKNGNLSVAGGSFSGGILATSVYGSSTSNGDINVSGGSISPSSIQAYGNLNITGGNLDIEDDNFDTFILYSQGNKVVINGGNIKIKANKAQAIYGENGVEIANSSVDIDSRKGIWSNGDLKIKNSDISILGTGSSLWSKSGVVDIADSAIIAVTTGDFGIVAGDTSQPNGSISVVGDSYVSLTARTALFAYSKTQNAITLGEGLYYGVCNASVHSIENDGYYTNSIWADDNGLSEIVISTTAPTCGGGSGVKVPNTGASDSSNVGGAIFASLAAASAGVLVVCYLVRYSRKRVGSRVRFKK